MIMAMLDMHRLVCFSVILVQLTLFLSGRGSIYLLNICIYVYDDNISNKQCSKITLCLDNKTLINCHNYAKSKQY